MPYLVGATLAYGPRRYDAYGTAFHEDERILGIVDRVEAVLDESLNQYVPQSMPNRVVVRLRDGSSREETVIESLGAPERLLSLDGVRDKAAALFDMVDPDIDLDRIVGGVADMADTPDIGAFVRSLVIPRYDAADDRAA